MHIFEIDDEELAARHFQSLGFSVERIEPTNEKRCDLLLSNGIEKYLIEVKKRELDEREAEGMKREDLYQHPSKSLGFDKRIEDKIDDSIRQLRKTATELKVNYQLIWISIIDRFHGTNSASYERVLSTVYGMKRLFFNDRTGSHSSRGCYYFLNSAFLKYKDLDAVIVAHNEGCELFVNNFSINYKSFLQSELYQKFGQGVRDPNILQEPDPNYFITDCDVDRKDTSKIIEFLARKYDILNVRSFDLMSNDITATVPLKTTGN